MNIPVACLDCDHKTVAKLATISSCTKCGSDNIDIDDAPKNDYPYQPTEPVVALEPEQAQDAWREDAQRLLTEEPADGVPQLEAKLKEIAAGVQATNPSMTHEAAIRVAYDTIKRYPKVAGLQ